MAPKGKKVGCPSCGADNLPGTLFCVQCGTYLPSGGPLRTEPLPEQENGRPAHRREDTEETQCAMISIEVEVLSSGRSMLFTGDREILVGRLDAAHGIFPELDMTADDGLEQGVSRRHARIYTRDGTCFVEDLDSTNGTFLNGERVTPYLPYAFHDGDVLSFGSLRLGFHVSMIDEDPTSEESA